LILACIASLKGNEIIVIVLPVVIYRQWNNHIRIMFSLAISLSITALANNSGEFCTFAPTLAINKNTLTFSDFNFHSTLFEGLNSMGFKTPTPIQAETIPIIQNKKDLIACAQTGTG